ncbi:polar amino acid transport system permease protein [Pararhizobium capsulatum DSM 1112]|uniref:Polar amino acid transport system permease protein n=1 Tax=Pararhizobium capsulatum DSM 1112 TaxID=1121113 RepID=A0ABU0C222_9HYPH|nr:ABC transporter permease subunit [Pararhizobium capsulatum]MDQ0323961.1 polar amino acid transport system permease protein [Pararhizobium capsulatum DSM 1112]
MSLPVSNGTPRSPGATPPPTTGRLIGTAIVIGGLVAVCAALAAGNAAPQLGSSGIVVPATLALAIVLMVVLVPLARSIANASASHIKWRGGDVVAARALAQKSRDLSATAIGLSVFLAVAVTVFFFLTVTDGAIRDTFLRGELIRTSAIETAKAFGINVALAIGAETLALAIGLLLALGRLLPGKGMGSVRLLAISYIDLFRGLPSVVVIYLICFGLPLAEIPVISEASPIIYAVIALSMTHAAYNAEIFRAGIESVHPSQYSAALSLGMTPARAMLHVILPQGVLRVFPPLLSGFVALQKDTALVNIVGIVDAFAQAKIYAANYYNLSAVTTVCILFVIITIPQTRLVDYMLARRAARARVSSQ